jgi:hypothetical protein
LRQCRVLSRAYREQRQPTAWGDRLAGQLVAVRPSTNYFQVKKAETVCQEQIMERTIGPVEQTMERTIDPVRVPPYGWASGPLSAYAYWESAPW